MESWRPNHGASGPLATGIATEAIISHDDQFRVVFFDAGAERTFGFARDEILGRPLDLLIPERFREPHHRHVRAFAAEATISRLTVTGRDFYTVVSLLARASRRSARAGTGPGDRARSRRVPSGSHRGREPDRRGEHFSVWIPSVPELEASVRDPGGSGPP